MSLNLIAEYFTIFLKMNCDETVQNLWNEKQHEFKKKFNERKNRPKKKSIYSIFATEERININKEKNIKLDNKEIMKEISKRWKNCKENCPERIAKIKIIADKDKERYENDKINFLKSNENNEKKRKEKKDLNAPNINKNAYSFFCIDQKLIIQNEENPLKGKKLLYEMAKRWRETKKIDRTKYLLLAEEDKERFIRENNKYQKIINKNYEIIEKKRKGRPKKLTVPMIK